MQKAFIETQFPIARLSAETLKERNAGASQTLTGLGKWWGRKQLIHVRATILGMLMPASNDPKKDREIYLKILTMDDDGAWLRQKGQIPVQAWRDAAPDDIQNKYFGAKGYLRGITDEQKEFIQAEIWESIDAQSRQQLDSKRKRQIAKREEFDLLPYSTRIKYCDRPEHVSGPSAEGWAEINAHLGTNAGGLSELIQQLGQRTFGHTPRVGDAFCGAGSIPFEAARIGCEAVGSDLNPAACLLSWCAINILGKGKILQKEIAASQHEICQQVANQLREWGVEGNTHGENPEAYLYCAEVKPPGCDYYIPLAPSWVIAEKYKIVANWRRVEGSDKLQPTVEAVSSAEFKLYKAKKGATVVDGRVVDPLDPSRSWSVEALRGPNGLRRWSNEDVVPRPEDVFQERLYCVRWINSRGERRYAAPDADDLARDEKVLELLKQRFEAWQQKGFIPSKQIESGYNTDQPIRERGWTHWHHLFTPRQLLVHGLFLEKVSEQDSISPEALAACLIGAS